MKRAHCLGALLWLLASTVLYGQQSGNQTSLDQLEAPSMPAATVIGAQVNEITRPGNVKDVNASLLNNFLDSGNNFIFPNNYGIEVNPYQLSGMKNFKYTDYLGDDLKQNLWRTFSFSVATNNSFIVNDTVSTNALGVGGRITLKRGQVSETLRKGVIAAINANRDILNFKSTFSSYFQSGFMAVDSLTSNYTEKKLQDFMVKAINDYYAEDNKARVLQYVNTAFDKIPDTTPLSEVEAVFLSTIDEMIADGQLTALQDLMKKVKNERGGIKWDINYAQALNFANQSWADMQSSQLGAWTNFSITPMVMNKETNAKEVSDFEFIFLARYIRVNDSFYEQFQPPTVTFSPGNNLDFGTRLVMDKEKFSLEAEYIHRFNDNDNTYKLVVNANYNITQDIVISYNIGKNYDMPGLTGNNLITGLTVNFGFGGYKLGDLIKPSTYTDALTE